MAWNPINAFNIPVGRTDAILVTPNLLYSSHCSILVQDVRRRNWRKSGDLYQQFLGDMRSPPLFVPMASRFVLPMEANLGGYYLRFQPVPYHKGLYVQIWEWKQAQKLEKIDFLDSGLTLEANSYWS